MKLNVNKMRHQLERSQPTPDPHSTWVELDKLLKELMKPYTLTKWQEQVLRGYYMYAAPRTSLKHLSRYFVEPDIDQNPYVRLADYNIDISPITVPRGFIDV